MVTVNNIINCFFLLILLLPSASCNDKGNSYGGTTSLRQLKKDNKKKSPGKKSKSPGKKKKLGKKKTSAPTSLPTLPTLPTLPSVVSTTSSVLIYSGPGVDASALQSTSSTRSPSLAPLAFPTVRPSSSSSTSPSYVPSRSPTSPPSSILSQHPSVLPTAIPSIEPSKKPSKAPSDVPTTFPTVLPSGIPSLLPTILPSITPTTKPNSGALSSSSQTTGPFCGYINPDVVTLPAKLGKTNYCYTIQARPGGQLLVNTQDEGCRNANADANLGVGDGYSGITYSSYQRIDPGGIAIYEGSFDGTIQLLQDPSLTEPTLEIVKVSLRSKTFNMILTVPNCGPPPLPPFCNSVTPNEYILPDQSGGSGCYVIQVRDGGKIKVDASDRTCFAAQLGGMVSAPIISNYQRTDPGGMAIYQGTESGSIQLVHDPSLVEPTFEISRTGSTFTGILKVKNC